VSLDAAPTKDILAQWRDSSVVVPHVSGDRDLVSAYDRLHARGLAVATNRRLSQGPYIRVLGQAPPAGAEVRRGTTVTLFLDPKLDHKVVCCDARSLSMPNFVGRNLGEVGEWLLRRSLYWKLIDAPALPPTYSPHMLDPYVVTSQKPVTGTKIPESIPPGSGNELKPIELRAKLATR
jgi:beta-lactam-binding protein with PASTA domain